MKRPGDDGYSFPCGDNIKPIEEEYRDLWKENAKLQKRSENQSREYQELRNALIKLRQDIVDVASDTVWVGASETACERITSILGDDWGVDGNIASNHNELNDSGGKK